jgi:hypothetical protein
MPRPTPAAPRPSADHENNNWRVAQDIEIYRYIAYVIYGHIQYYRSDLVLLVSNGVASKPANGLSAIRSPAW